MSDPYSILGVDRNATDEDVKKMELKIVNSLKYDLTVPTTNKFLGRFLRVEMVYIY